MTTISRRFNYTKRVKIHKNQVALDVETDESGNAVAVLNRLDLSARGEHDAAVWGGAEVFVEARRYSTESWHRQKLGTVEALAQGPMPKRFRLEGFEEEQAIVFRVKVVDADSRLLADGDDLRVGDRRFDQDPLIYLVPAELGEELWRVDFRDSEGPCVLINKRLPNYSGLLTRDPIVRGLVLPQILRLVLPEVARSEQRSDLWVRRWCEFAARLGCDEPPEHEDEDSIDDWVADVVGKFALEQRFAAAARDVLQRVAD